MDLARLFLQSCPITLIITAFITYGFYSCRHHDTMGGMGTWCGGPHPQWNDIIAREYMEVRARALGTAENSTIEFPVIPTTTTITSGYSLEVTWLWMFADDSGEFLILKIFPMATGNRNRNPIPTSVVYLAIKAVLIHRPFHIQRSWLNPDLNDY